MIKKKKNPKRTPTHHFRFPLLVSYTDLDGPFSFRARSPGFETDESHPDGEYDAEDGSESTFPLALVSAVSIP